MYICLDCGELFEEPCKYVETHGLDSPPYEKYMGCPHCGGAYVETIQCDICGEWISGEYVKLDNDMVVCDNCYVVKCVEDGDI